MVSEPLDSFWAVIPAGGAGTRLWPLSRASRPKFLLDLIGSGRTLLQSTYDRLEPLVGDRLVVVTGRAHADAVAGQLEGSGAEVLTEPSPRDSMAAIGLAAAVLEKHDPTAIMGSFAADHHIPDPVAFRACVRRAVAAAESGWLVTLGITATHPATGFGYIRAGETLPGIAAKRVLEFVEKPSSTMAHEYVAAGYRWNAGMFVVRPTVLLDLLAENHPEFAAALRGIAANPDSLDEVWPALPKIAIDHAVAEPAAAAGRVAVVEGSFGWDDIGDFASLSDLLDGRLDGQTDGFRGLGGGPVFGVASTGFVISKRPVAVVGVEGVVVVDTDDALLVTTREHAQQVKDVVALLKETGRSQLT